MSRNRARDLLVAGTIGVLFLCSACHTGRPSVDLAVKRLLSNVPTLNADRQRNDDEREYKDALAVLAENESLHETVQLAREAEAARRDADPRCARLYATVALDCWPHLTSDDATDSANQLESAAWIVYHHCVAQFIHSSVIHGLLDPAQHVAFDVDGEPAGTIPISHQGFPWSQDDFSQLHLVKRSDRTVLARYWSENGIGVPLIAVRNREQTEEFLGPKIPFSATGILRPPTSEELSIGGASERNDSVFAVLELHDPLRVQQVAHDHRRWKLARDISAPLEMANLTIDRDKLTSFLNPGRTDELGGLRMIEPYQPGKVPVVFVHGLLSDKFTWVDLVNDLRSVPGFSDKFQLWSFQYPTGQTFVRSAAEMRRDLSQIVHHLDPEGDDEALAKMVLVGHSMGGLVSKLQITESESAIWDSVANQPLEDIETSPEIRREIEQMFFFEPLPFVSRVVFIGSPHQGSKMAKSFIGTLGSALVITPRERLSRLMEIVDSNPDVFKGDLAKRLPTSVELLRPDNPILLAAYKLDVNPNVRLHTIIGTGGELSDGTPADGVVAVESARHPGTVSERRIDATHTQLTRHPEVTEEVVRILEVHLQETLAADGPVERIADASGPTVQ